MLRIMCTQTIFETGNARIIHQHVYMTKAIQRRIAQRQQRERHADLVVEIPRRGVDIQPCAQRTANQFLGAGLPHAARDAQHLGGPNGLQPRSRPGGAQPPRRGITKRT